MNRLKEIRTSAGYSLEQLAKLLGISRQAINAWEKGSRKIPDERKAELAKIFGLEESDFNEQQVVVSENIIHYGTKNGDISVEVAHDDLDEVRNRTIKAYGKALVGEYDGIIAKLKERKEEQRKVVRKISKTILAEDKAFMVEQIDHIEMTIPLFVRFNQVVERLDAMDSANKDDYYNRIMEFLYAMEVAMDEDMTIEKTDLKSGMKISNIKQAKKLFDNALKKK